ncbi:RDD family protein [Streptomyces sparsogenes]|uniref:RDD family protein n=3 Tax=Streptomyces sparsogenes TaxID=67365 RepID=UPI0008250BC8|nr:RDD family protein [Streptomyces sparsogenes]
MSAPTSGSADGSSIPGFYPDPSIPGYIRYWNGAAWVPGTSQPAPSDGEAMPAPPPGVTHTQVTAPVPDETGPMFLDEEPPAAGRSGEQGDGGRALPELRPRGEMDVRGDARGGRGPEPVPPAANPNSAPSPGAGGAVPAAMDWNDPQRLHGSRPEPASAWQADASRQSGFGGDQDRRVSWGADPAGAGGPASGGPAGPGVPDPRQAVTGPGSGGPVGADAPASAQALPPARRAAELPSGQPAPGAGGGAAAPGGGRTTGGDGTISIRAVRPGRAAPGAGGGQAAGPAAGAPSGGAPTRDDGTLTIRALGRGAAKQGGGAAAPGRPGGAAPAQGAGGLPPQGGVLLPGGPPPQGGPAGGPAAPPGGVPAQGGAPGARPQQQPLPPQQPHPQPQQQQPQQQPQPQQPQQQQPQPGWQQQVRQLAQQPGPGAPGTTPAPGAAPGGPPEGVIPWKPPVDNPFLRAAQTQGRPAALGRRLLARLIDSAVLLGVVGAAAYPLWTKASDHFDEKVERAKLTGETVTVYWLDGTTGAYLGAVLGLLLLVGVIYEALPTAKWGGTLGKKLCGLRVLDIEEHDTPSFGAALRRWLVYGVLGLLAVGVLNVLWCLFDRPWRQCWHDKAARTFVAGRG